MLDDFLIRATIAGVGVAIAAAPLGCFVVWRRMAYFGDATAHAGLLGVAIALVVSLPVTVGVLAIALAMSLAMTVLAARNLANDTILGVLSHSALALGLVAAAILPGARVDLSAYLFGDILAVSRQDLLVIWAGAALVVGLIVWRWSALLTATLSPELASAAGLNPRREGLIVTITLAVLVAVAIKVVGALLIAAMVVIPAATARSLAGTPETMAIAAALIGTGAAVSGVWGSTVLDSPTGPTIVCAAALAFALVRIGSYQRDR